MKIEKLLESVLIEGAGQGDVVFMATPAGMSAADYVKFAEAFKSHAQSIRKSDAYFPRCIVLPPGVSIEVARAQIEDRIEVAGTTCSAPLIGMSPDAGCPHG
jgi:hypothetical protein